ncbi:HNH endonuclease [Halomonas saccharevitans]|uniref:HNH endonuclease n=1 Tax=Halomonas saccharevitans TaxID=416872 RepID=UPI001FE9EB0C|nr:HNH endonuclease [Halomonas saccharevitans]
MEEIAANLLEFDRYRISSDAGERAFYAQRLRLGKIFGCMVVNGRLLFGPSRFIGYKSNTMTKHIAFDGKSGSVTTPRISSVLGAGHGPDAKAEDEYRALCAEVGAEPSSKIRTYWRLPTVNGATAHAKTRGEEGFPDEVGEYFEGASKMVRVNVHERDPRARRECIAHYGCACVVCGLEFGRIYGPIGEGFIHVHHVTPLSKRSGEHMVNPVDDLRPVCPNCHAMIHTSDPPFTVEELRELIEEAAVRARPNKALEPTR